MSSRTLLKQSSRPFQTSIQLRCSLRSVKVDRRSISVSIFGSRGFDTIQPKDSLTFRKHRHNVLVYPCCEKRHLIFPQKHYATQTVKVPEMAESISEGTLRQWQKKIGDHVNQDDEVATIETDKIDVAVNAPVAGKILEFLVKEDDTVTVGQDLISLELGDHLPPKSDEAHGDTVKSTPKGPASKEQVISSDNQASDHKARELDSATDSSPDPGSLKSEPVQQQTSQQSPVPPTDSNEAPQSKETQHPIPIANRQERKVKMNRMRLRIAERLKQSQDTAASLTTFNEVDMTEILRMRKNFKEDVLKQKGVKLGFMGAFSRACVLALKDLPTVNAAIQNTPEGDVIVYHDYVDISIAVATDKGLVTPIVRNAEAMDILQVEAAISELGKKARENKLSIEDMAGGTFTISNGGVFGSLLGTPIINMPQTAVLGLHSIKEKPVAINGAVEIRPMMYLALTYDHRLLDGREAVTFLIKVKQFIENPQRMLLGA